MSANLPPKSSLAAGAFALLLGTANCLAADGVAESFDRMLAHEPGRVTTATAADGNVDPLMKAMVSPLREGVQSAAAPMADPVAESFARMLAHAPSALASPASPNGGADPLISAMVEPLRQWLANGPTTARLAAARTEAAKH